MSSTTPPPPRQAQHRLWGPGQGDAVLASLGKDLSFEISRGGFQLCLQRCNSRISGNFRRPCRGHAGGAPACARTPWRAAGGLQGPQPPTSPTTSEGTRGVPPDSHGPGGHRDEGIARAEGGLGVGWEPGTPRDLASEWFLEPAPRGDLRAPGQHVHERPASLRLCGARRRPPCSTPAQGCALLPVCLGSSGLASWPLLAIPGAGAR